MGCLTFSAAPVYDSEFRAESCNDFVFSATCVNDFDFVATRVYNFLFGVSSLSRLSFRCELVCSVPPYLEIEPDMIWLTDWSAENEVISNTLWNVD